jgi:lipopolysaccharide transport system permease protein
MFAPRNPPFLRHPASMVVHNMFLDLLTGQELAWQFTVRDIRAPYRQTALGLLFTFILPLANTVTWLFLSSTCIV